MGLHIESKERKKEVSFSDDLLKGFTFVQEFERPIMCNTSTDRDRL